MKLLTYPAAIAASFVLALAASADNIIEQDYTVSDVLEVHVSSGITLELTQGDTESLKLKAPANILKQIRVDLTNHKLSLRIDSDITNIAHWFSKDKIIFTLVVKDLNLLDVSGGVEANVGKLTLDKLIIKNSGGSESKFADLQIKNDVDIEISGGSEVHIGVINSEHVNLSLSGGAEFAVDNSGTTNSLKIEASGGSECKAKKLASVSAEVVAGGASEVDVKVSKTLKVSAGGASNIKYYGTPTISSNVGGASELSGNN